MIDPFAYTRRSPLQRRMAEHGANWAVLGSDVAYVERTAAGSALPAIAIADLSPLPRIGFKGRGTLSAMQSRGVALEASPNRCFRQPDGSLCLVLAPSEVLLLSPLNGIADGPLFQDGGVSFSDDERTYELPRRDSHAWLAVAGQAAPGMFAKLCAVDMRLDRFSNLSIAQTSVARMNAIVARVDVGSTPVFHLLVDSAAAVYFCDCIADAAEEFGGGLVGLGTLQKLADG